MATDLELGHKEIMESNNITQSDLPKEIEAKILSLTMQISSYDSAPTQELKERIEHQSAKIGHEILDYLEKDLPEEPVNVEGQNQQEQAQAAAAQQESTAQNSETVKQNNTEKRGGNGLFNFFGW